ncbi:PQQ-binding-like beta-propeller repeat protein [Paraflavisolibacter sp. H34]|uniref:PQQ-binding-like beta-propeller repeat protein n=1 Tax=Huijunlia imazamoxiresistens TaxID=3127457 RepID=UPI003018D838
MRNTVLCGVLIIISFLSCSKGNSESETSSGTEQKKYALSSFSVTVLDRSPGTVILQWSPAENRNNADTVKYAILLNNRKLDSGLVRTIDTLYRLSPDSVYTGKVMAYTQRGDTASAPFSLRTARGYVLISSNEGSLKCFEAYTGAKVWSFPKVYAASGSGPIISNDTVFALNSQDEIRAMEASTGKLLWSRPGAGISSLLSYHQGILYARKQDSYTAVDSKTGQPLRTYPLTPHFYTRPVIAGNRVFFGSTYSAGTFYAYDLDGTLLWKVENLNMICNRPLLVKEAVILTAGGKIMAFSQASGTLLWQQNLSTPSLTMSPVYYEGNILVFAEGLGLCALNPVNGFLVWSSNVGFSIASHALPAFGNGLIYTCRNTGLNDGINVVAVDGKTGQQVWNREISWIKHVDQMIFFNNRLMLKSYYEMYTLNALNGNFTYNTTGISNVDLINYFTIFFEGRPYTLSESAQFQPE